MIQPWKVGDKVRFTHQKEGEAKFTIANTLKGSDGGPMVELSELPGHFAAHLFVAFDYPNDSIVPRRSR